MKVGILTGGGDCPGLNPAIRGFVMQALDYGFETWGVRQGWRGLVDEIVEEQPLTVDRVEELIYRGGTALGSSRTNPYNASAQGQREKMLGTIRRRGFQAIVALGGEDTLGVAAKLYKDGVPTVGIPKTMDNDLSDTDYTFGFDSAVSVDVDAIDRLRDTARSHGRAIVLEVMGRHAGWVALHTAIAGGADAVLLPETRPDMDAVCEAVKRAHQRKGYALVVASEGASLGGGKAEADARDEFGHQMLGEQQVGETAAKIILDRTGIETRAAVTGHVQRGGSPTAFDRVLASRLGMRAARCVKDGEFGKMVALHGTSVVAVDIAAAVGTLRTVPQELIESVAALFGK